MDDADILTISAGKLSYEQCKAIYQDDVIIALEQDAWHKIERAAQIVKKITEEEQLIYGVNTGVGKLAYKRISVDQLSELQRHIVVSHAVGVGNYFLQPTVRLILALKINSLAQGYSGIRPTTVEYLMAFYNQKLLPCIPEKGSVGASGDLAPLSYIAAKLLGYGEVYDGDNIISAEAALKKLKLNPIKLAAKEGLTLVNGTQVSTALALEAVLLMEKVFHAALITGSLSVEASLCGHTAFDQRFQSVRGSAGAQHVGENYRRLLANSTIYHTHLAEHKVQDPYSLRCQPVVMGACLDQIRYAAKIILAEANGISDNPIIFDDGSVLAGGNFHAESVALAADALACAIAEVGSIAERRIALLIDKSMSSLPSFLVKDSGLNSGFMMAQVTAAALVSENKSLAHPASVDSIPTSANQEDHVSMATYGARRLLTMVNNVANIVAIELLAATQGIDFRRPLKTSEPLEQVVNLVRSVVPHYDSDRYLSDDLALARELVMSGKLGEVIGFDLAWLQDSEST